MKSFLYLALIVVICSNYVQLICLPSLHECSKSEIFKCIPKDWVCDYSPDCEDGSDEANCPKIKCKSDEFRCKNSDVCIKKSQQCDGNIDCIDNSDEIDCTINHQYCDKITEYDCKNDAKLECIPLENVCSKKLNCTNKNNLNEDCNRNMCLPNRCSHKCVNKYSSFTCDCPKDMKLDKDKLNCIKMDICLEKPEICEQDCTTTTKGHICSCYSGYTMVESKCLLNNSEVIPHLLYLSFDGIYDINLFTNKKNRKLISIPDKLAAFDVNFDGNNLDIYSSHVDNASILSLNIVNEWMSYFKTKEPKDEIKMYSKILTLPSSFYAIATDVVRNLVFWTDIESSKISVLNASNLDQIDIVVKDCYYPISLEVDPISEKIFWIDLGNKVVGPRILMSGMDGSDVTVLIKSGLHKPTTLALDIENQKLYWNDLFPGSIKFLDLKLKNEKNNVNVVFETYNFAPISIAIYKNRVYWSDLHQNRIYSVHKISGNDLITVLEQVRSSSIRIFSPLIFSDLNKNVNSQSSNSSCSGIYNPCDYSCLPTSFKRIAKCFGSFHQNINKNKNKGHSSFWWFIIIPIVLLSFGGIAFIKYRNFKKKSLRHVLSTPNNVYVYNHVQFWDDGTEQLISDSQIIGVSDTSPILETV